MNIFLWIIQGTLAGMFLMTGVLKLSQKKETVLERRGDQMGWVEGFSQPQLNLIGFLEVLGALGLLLPALTGIPPILVPLAALGLAALMVGAAVTHLHREETGMTIFTLVMMVLALFVAYGRFAIDPL